MNHMKEALKQKMMAMKSAPPAQGLMDENQPPLSPDGQKPGSDLAPSLESLSAGPDADSAGQVEGLGDKIGSSDIQEDDLLRQILMALADSKGAGDTLGGRGALGAKDRLAEMAKAKGLK